MSTPSSNMYFEAIHTAATPPSDPNLFTAAEIVAGSFDSAAVSTATSKAVSTVNAAAPDSTSISQANSRAVSAASVGSVADSKAVSNSAPTSIADSKSISNSVNISIADSKAVSVQNSVPILTVVANSQNVSTADSKAVSVATGVPAGGRTVTNTNTYLSNNATANVKDFGAIGNGVADDTAAMQAAHNTGAIVRYPAGIYKFSTISNILSGGIIGDGPGKTILLSTDTTTGQAISYTGRLPAGGGFGGTFSINIPTFRDFTLQGDATKTVGSGIQIVPPAGETSYLHFENLIINTFPICIDFVAASLWKILGCSFSGYPTAALQVANTNSNDSGDCAIMGSLFQGSVSSGPAILYKSAAGLKVIGNKMNVGTYGLLCQWTGVGSGDLIFAHNSVENMSVAGLQMSRVGASVFHNLNVTGNEFSLCTKSVVCDANLMLTLVIIGNIISMNTGVTTGIDITTATGVSISGNAFRDNGGTSTAIRLTTCDSVDIGINTYAGTQTKTVLTTCTNIFDHAPYSGSTVLPNTTFTTIFTLPTTPALYEMFAYLPSASGGSALTIGTARLGVDGANLTKIDGATGSSIQITMSGLNVQLWHNTGVSQTFSWGYRRIA